MDQSFEVSIGVMKNGELSGGGRFSKGIYAVDCESTKLCVLAKKSMVKIPSVINEHLCAARAFVTAKCRLEESPNKFSQFIDPRKCMSTHSESQRSRAIKLHMDTGVSTQQPVPVRELHKFENHFDMQAIVISGDLGNEVVYTGIQPRKNKVFLYHRNSHYDLILNIDGFLVGEHKWCEVCTAIHKSKQVCIEKCRSCGNKGCVTSSTDVKFSCQDCNMTCNGLQCYEQHKLPRVYTRGANAHGERMSLCQQMYKCAECGKIMDRKQRDISKHVCSEWYCRCCNQYATDDDHLCYYRIKKPKRTSGKFIFYDVETTQDQTYSCGNYQARSRPGCKQCTSDLQCASCVKCVNCGKALCGVKQHIPNFIIAQTACDICKSDTFTPDSTCTNCGRRCEDCRNTIVKKGHKSLQGESTTKCVKCSFKRESIIHGLDAVDVFCKQFLHPAYAGFTVLSHNGRSFDIFFIARWCVDHGIFPDITFAGARIMTMSVGDTIKVRFIDSLSFLGCKLKHLPKALNLDASLKKGDFPYLFNKSHENQSYVGPLPDIATYNVDYMMPRDREEFMAFYTAERARGAIFDFQKEILDYTRSDVCILREACMKFRDMFREVTALEIKTKQGHVEKTEGLDCFAFATIASSAMQFLREKTLKEFHRVTLTDGRQGQATLKRGQWVYETGQVLDQADIGESQFVKSLIPQIPAKGYTKHFNDSQAAIAWLEWMSHKLGRPIQHSRNGGEFLIPGTNYRVDGYDKQQKRIYEFYGCYWHGHVDCCKNPSAKDPRTGKTAYQMQREAEKRILHIKSLGYQATTVYECVFIKQAKTDSELQAFLKDLTCPEPPLKISQALYGGRVSPLKLHYKAKPGEKIKYFDIKSLYPHCMFNSPYIHDHPTVITDQKSMDYTLQSYVGIAKATVLPPRGLYIPVLPYRVNKSLKFPLCAKCAKEERHTSCTCTVSERQLTGVWPIQELKVALAKGYKLTYLHEVYNYCSTVQGEDGVFREYVTTFLALKEQSSGFPSWVETEADKDTYIRDFYDRQGVKLDKSKVEKNPALRFIAKSYLNSLWGKMSQGVNKPKTRYIKTMADYCKIVNDPTLTVTDFHIFNNEVVVVETKAAADYPVETAFQNFMIGCFTTSYARLHLYNILDTVGTSCLYFDTDSVLWVEKDGVETLKEGHLLGELTNELNPGVHITEFFSSGPKSYSYYCSDGTAEMKLKGVTRHYINCKHINPEVMKKVIFGEVKSVTLPKYNQICKDKRRCIIFNRTQTKKFKKVFTKRAIVHDTYDTLPFGY